MQEFKTSNRALYLISIQKLEKHIFLSYQDVTDISKWVILNWLYHKKAQVNKVKLNLLKKSIHSS